MPDLTPEQIAELRSIAEEMRAKLSTASYVEWGKLKARLADAASPARLLSLLDELERLRAAMPSDAEMSSARKVLRKDYGVTDSPRPVLHDFVATVDWLSRIDAARKGPGR